MGLFSFLKKKKGNSEIHSDAAKSVFDATIESVTAYQMMEEDKKKNGKQTKEMLYFSPNI